MKLTGFLWNFQQIYEIIIYIIIIRLTTRTKASSPYAPENQAPITVAAPKILYWKVTSSWLW